MTDYSLWEVVFNGDSLVPTRVIEGVVQPVTPTTVEQRLARNNKLKARGTLLMALPDKHQLKFNIHNDAKTLMETYCCSCKLKLLVDAADIKLRLLEQSAVVGVLPHGYTMWILFATPLKVVKSLAHVWHKRLGHISETGLQVLEKQGLFGKKSLDLWGLSQVESLREWKQLVENQTGRTVKKLRTNNGLEFCNRRFEQLCIESGIARHLTVVESLRGKRYFLSIVNDYSRRVWVYILRFKHEAFGKFKEWKQLVENQTGRTVKKLRTDNGLEFCNRRFEQLCIESGIARHLTVVGMPQQNGVAERMNKTLMDMEKQDLRISRSSNWAKAVRHTSIRVILALTACKDYELEQLDVKTVFLHRNLEEVIYMKQPLGYEQDDMLIAYKSKAKIGSSNSLLKKKFDIKELGEAKKILDNGKSVKMPLGGHFKLSLKDCPIRYCNVERMSKVPYANAVGSLMYMMVCTRPDIAYAGTIHLSRNHVFHERNKHINVRYHFIREVLEAKTVKVLKANIKPKVEIVEFILYFSKSP
nr:hypothetical protein [Tanacetum cinerariifolium]